MILEQQMDSTSKDLRFKVRRAIVEFAQETRHYTVQALKI